MPLFDFFKRKKKSTDLPKEAPSSAQLPIQPQPPEDVAGSVVGNDDEYALFKPYNAYLIKCISLMVKGDYAPIAAYERPSGEVLGTLFVHVADDYQPEMGVPETLEELRDDLDEKLARGEATSYILFYHSRMRFDGTTEPAETSEELGAITAALHRNQGASVHYNFKYAGDTENIHFGTISPFSDDQANELLTFQVDPEKELFTEKIEVHQPMETLPNGIVIKSTTNGQTSDLWSGLRGFTTHRGDTVNRFRGELTAVALHKPAYFATENVSVHLFGEGTAAIRAVKYRGAFLSSFPVYPIGPVVDVKTSGIDEWENSGYQEAIVKTQGKETFQLYFYATDYARNRNVYRTTPSLNIQVSAVIYALDYQEEKPAEEGAPIFADDFASFMPSGHAMEFGCYNFMSKIIEVEEVAFNHLGGVRGYILTFKMINKEDEPELYTMEAFVNPENIRFDGPPKIGDKVSGALQLMGEIVGPEL